MADISGATLDDGEAMRHARHDNAYGNAQPK
jgi:hypothetical protein